jgi:hypothetical protein
VTSVEIESDVFYSLQRLFKKGDLKREDVAFEGGKVKPGYRFSLACRHFGLSRNPEAEAAFDSLIANPSHAGLVTLLRLCHVACDEIFEAHGGSVVEIYAVNRPPVAMIIDASVNPPMIRLNLKPGYDTDYMLTPDSLASLVHDALRNT